ncbi:hypothetical protein LABOLPEG_00030 [Pseudomonas phage phi 21A]|nr:hypothetical protein LABOLPEG_00030 [Pseudomonas phage phi 21A]
MTQIICLTSVRGRSGKDTLLEQLQARGHEVARVAFGDILKEQCAREIGSWRLGSEELLAMFHNDSKDLLHADLAIRLIEDGPYKQWLMYKAERNGDGQWMERPRTPRWHLQQYGTEYRRNYLGEPDVWLNEGLNSIRQMAMGGCGLIVVTDLRQRNEYEALKNLKGVLWANGSASAKIEKVSMVRLHRMWFLKGVDDADFHATDLDLIGHRMDAVVLNNWGYPALMVDQLIQQEVLK